MNAWIKSLIKYVWYFGQFHGFITIPLGGMTVVLSILTFLAVEFGIKLTAWETIGLFLFIFCAGVYAGKKFVQYGFLHYLNELGNKQNEQIWKINEIYNEVVNKK